MSSLPNDSKPPTGTRRRGPGRRIWLSGAVVAAGLLTAWTLQAAWPTEPLEGPYMVATVQRGDIEDAVLATGTLQAFELVNVGAQVTGELKVLHVGLGDSVRKGQPIAEIDASAQQNALKQAQAREGAAQAQLHAKESMLRQSLLTFQRQRGMYKHGASARETYEAAEAAAAVAQAEVDALKANLEEMRIALDTARVNLGYTQIQSPMNGVVVAVVASRGQTLNASVSAPTIVKVAQIDTMRIRVEISEADVVRVSPGLAASFTILGEPGRPRPVTLKAVELAPESLQADASAGSATSKSDTAVYYSGLMEAPNGDGTLRIGMTVQVRIVLRRATGVLTVPMAALRHRDTKGRRSVAVLNSNGRLQEQWITVGMDDKNNAQVVSGLKEGDQVVFGEQAPQPNARRASGTAGS